ncbi:hypothetical protein Rsub_12045 [Raphidocelis subcapitata]|uniref:Uncharacterized protein n=1 Tax=Raphidocelis subcapitata TaxID=307507 RepID=A0A2V0PQ12_9CHLO|nr:hypothetical protein Rsub_12045 [Raphidocelis subcapitata]|eukprot:GBF99285.1 hypothetical protein Rsub_12045 [Raphidocelis subcapitata]
MGGASHAGGFVRVAFVFDRRDSDLFHVLEDTVRSHNAVVLGLAQPAPPGAASAPGPDAAAAAAAPPPTQPQQGRPTRASTTAAAGAGPGGGAQQQQQQQQQQQAQQARGGFHARFADDASRSTSDDNESEAAPTPADLRLDAALAQYVGVAIDPRLLQALGTRAVGEEEGGVVFSAPVAGPCGLDLITGFHLIAGEERVVVLEAAAGGGGALPLPPHLRAAAAAGGGNVGGSVRPPAGAQPPAGGLASAAVVAPAPPVAAAKPQRQPRATGLSTASTAAAAVAAAAQAPPQQAQPAQAPQAQPAQAQPAAPPAWLSGLEVLREIAAWALEERRPCADEGWRERRVLLHPGAASPARLYSELGVGLWVVKLRAGLQRLAAEAASYASGRVRPDCVAGLTRLLALRGAAWARQADALGLWPSAAQVHLVDKKFGGELTKGDVLGVEAEEADSDEEEEEGRGRPLGGLQDRAARASAAGSAKSGGPRSVQSGRSGSHRSRASRRRSRGSSKSGRSRKRRRALRIAPLCTRNEAYAHLRAEAERARAARDLTEDNKRALVARSASPEMRAVREAWASWNPQRAAARDLEARVAAGELTLQDSVDARRAAEAGAPREPPAGTLMSVAAAAGRGWFPHPAPFRWPAVRPPGEFGRPELRPSEARAAELREPWDEAASAGGAALAAAAAASVSARRGRAGRFRLVVRPGEGGGVFTRDPGFWESVHLPPGRAAAAGGDSGGGERGGAGARKSRGRKGRGGRRKGRAGTGLRVLLAVPWEGAKAAQVDRFKGLLRGAPLKKGLALAHTEPPPLSLDLGTPWRPPGQRAGGGAASAEERARFVGGRDFDTLARGRPRSCVYRPGGSDAWGAGLHDD